MKVTELTYYLIKLPSDWVTGSLLKGQEILTKFEIETFTNYEGYLNRCKDLKIDPTDEIFLEEIKIPSTISALQGKIQLLKMGLLETIETNISDSTAVVKIYWKDSITWERSSPILNRIASVIGMTEQDLDTFFLEASKIQ